jgi:hypothetical protein
LAIYLLIVNHRGELASSIESNEVKEEMRNLNTHIERVALGSLLRTWGLLLCLSRVCDRWVVRCPFRAFRAASGEENRSYKSRGSAMMATQIDGIVQQLSVGQWLLGGERLRVMISNLGSGTAKKKKKQKKNRKKTGKKQKKKKI